MNRQRIKTQILELILYIGAFLLLAEWMYTFGEVADIDYRTLLYIYAIICFFVSFCRSPGLLSIPIKALSLLRALYLIDIEGERSIRSWLQTFGTEVLFNVKSLFTYHWNDLTSLFRSEEHTSELQSRFDLVCRLLLEKKNRDNIRLMNTSFYAYVS